jgi:hypothetical protein
VQVKPAPAMSVTSSSPLVLVGTNPPSGRTGGEQVASRH